MSRKKNGGATVSSENPVKKFFSGLSRTVKDGIYGLSVKIHQKCARKGVKKNLNRSKRNKNLFFYLMMALPLLQFCIFYIGVNVNSFILAFKEYDYYTGAYQWVGFANFAAVFRDIANVSYLKIAFRNSVVLFAFNIAVGTTLAILFSYYIYKKFVMYKFFQVILFLPSIISSVALVLVFKYFAEIAIPEIMLRVFNMEIQGLLSNGATKLGTIIFFNIWIGFGVQILMYSGAMGGISESIVESAELDGATAMKEFWHITLPLIYPTVVVFIVVAVAGIFVNQMNVYSFYGENADYSIYSVGYYLYMNIASQNTTIAQYPYLSAFGLVLTIICVPITLLIKKGLEKIGPQVD